VPCVVGVVLGSADLTQNLLGEPMVETFIRSVDFNPHSSTLLILFHQLPNQVLNFILGHFRFPSRPIIGHMDNLAVPNVGCNPLGLIFHIFFRARKKVDFLTSRLDSPLGVA